jgi:hypothetical protein
MELDVFAYYCHRSTSSQRISSTAARSVLWQVMFYIRGPQGAGKVYSEMFKDKEDNDWKYTYLIVDVTAPTATRLMLESYMPAWGICWHHFEIEAEISSKCLRWVSWQFLQLGNSAMKRHLACRLQNLPLYEVWFLIKLDCFMNEFWDLTSVQFIFHLCCSIIMTQVLESFSTFSLLVHLNPFWILVLFSASLLSWAISGQFLLLGQIKLGSNFTILERTQNKIAGFVNRNLKSNGWFGRLQCVFGSICLVFC